MTSTGSVHKGTIILSILHNSHYKLTPVVWYTIILLSAQIAIYSFMLFLLANFLFSIAQILFEEGHNAVQSFCRLLSRSKSTIIYFVNTFCKYFSPLASSSIRKTPRFYGLSRYVNTKLLSVGVQQLALGNLIARSFLDQGLSELLDDKSEKKSLENLIPSLIEVKGDHVTFVLDEANLAFTEAKCGEAGFAWHIL